MNKYILGSGVTGLLARHILGDSWKIIPFGRSRFYSTRPVLGDNFIVRSDNMDQVLQELEFMPRTYKFTRAFSIAGQLIFSEQSFAKNEYLDKVFGDNTHPAAHLLTKMEYNVYRASTLEVYLNLLTKYTGEIRKSVSEYGKVIGISDHHIKTDKADLEFDRIVSAIPLDALLLFAGKVADMPARDIWYYHVRTPSINLEGASEALVADKPFDFFKVTHVGPNEYLFHCLRDLVNPEQYLAAFLGSKLELLNQTSVAKALPTGMPPDLKDLEAGGVYPAGDHAQWDAFMDVSSCVNRLRKISNLSG